MSMAMMAAVVGSITAYVVLFIATAQARMGEVVSRRATARASAEAGLVIATQKLWNEATLPYPQGCPAGATQTVTEQVNTATGPQPVQITVTNCGSGNPHTLTAQVTY